jgi:hypothetical protein
MNRAKLMCPDLVHIILIGRVDCGLDSGLIAETSASWPITIGPWTLSPGVCIYIPLPVAQVATRFASAFLSSSRAVSPAASLPSPRSTMYYPPLSPCTSGSIRSVGWFGP